MSQYEELYVSQEKKMEVIGIIIVGVIALIFSLSHMSTAVDCAKRISEKHHLGKFFQVVIAIILMVLPFHILAGISAGIPEDDAKNGRKKRRR